MNPRRLHWNTEGEAFLSVGPHSMSLCDKSSSAEEPGPPTSHSDCLAARFPAAATFSHAYIHAFMELKINSCGWAARRCPPCWAAFLCLPLVGQAWPRDGSWGYRSGLSLTQNLQGKLQRLGAPEEGDERVLKITLIKDQPHDQCLPGLCPRSW